MKTIETNYRPLNQQSIGDEQQEVKQTKNKKKSNKQKTTRSQTNKKTTRSQTNKTQQEVKLTPL